MWLSALKEIPRLHLETWVWFLMCNESMTRPHNLFFYVSDLLSSSGKKILRFLWIYARVTSWLAPTCRLTEMMDLEVVRAFIRRLWNDVRPTQQPLGDLWFTSEMGRRRAGRQEEAAAGDPRRHNRDAEISRGGEEPSTNTLWLVLSRFFMYLFFTWVFLFLRLFTFTPYVCVPVFGKSSFCYFCA